MAPLTVFPEDQFRFEGHYPYGDDSVLSYTVQGRGVLESPLVEAVSDSKIIHHRLTIEPGKNPLEPVVGGIDDRRSGYDSLWCD